MHSDNFMYSCIKIFHVGNICVSWNISSIQDIINFLLESPLNIYGKEYFNLCSIIWKLMEVVVSYLTRIQSELMAKVGQCH